MNIEQCLRCLADCIQKMQSTNFHSPEFYQAYSELLFVDSDLYTAIARLIGTDPQACETYYQAMNIPDALCSKEAHRTTN